MKRHLECVEYFYGGSFDLKIATPSHVTTRGGVSHLETLIGHVKGFSTEWSSGLLLKNDASKARSRRGTISTDLFTAKPGVKGKRILLFDDTFTTGGTMASAAYALKRSGATAVVGLAFGRQLNAGWKDSERFVTSLGDRGLDVKHCIVHASHYLGPQDKSIRRQR
ncbi:ComF family protein [Streptomyces albidoflavus]